MDRFEAIDKLSKVQQLIEAKRYGEAMREVGMTDDQFPHGQSFDELFQVFQVRVHDLKKIAGLE